MSTELRGRVRAQREKTEQNGNGAVEKHNAAPQTVAQFIEAMKGEIARALPKHLNADRLARIMLTEVRRTPLLAKCTPESFGGAIMTCAQLGLEPGVTGEAYLLPFKNKKLSYEAKRDVYEVQLIIGYQGMLSLFWRSPLAKSFDAQTVHAEDDFDYAYGLAPKLSHRPSMKDDRGEVIAWYAVATMTNGGAAFIVMSRSDIEKIRTRSRAKDDGPWKTDYDAMAKKTCVRQLFKLLPKSAELSQAIAQDEAVRTDWSGDGIDLQPDYPDAVAGEVEQDEAAQDDGPEPPQDALVPEAELPVEDPPDTEWPAAATPGGGR